MEKDESLTTREIVIDEIQSPSLIDDSFYEIRNEISPDSLDFFLYGVLAK